MFTRIRDAREHAKELRFAKDHLEGLLAEGVDPEEAADATVLAVQKKFGGSGGRGLDIEKLMAIIALIMQLLEMFRAKASAWLIALVIVAAAAGPVSADHGPLVGSRRGHRAGSCGVAILRIRQAPRVNARRSGSRRTALCTPRVRLSGACLSY